MTPLDIGTPSVLAAPLYVAWHQKPSSNENAPHRNKIQSVDNPLRTHEVLTKRAYFPIVRNCSSPTNNLELSLAILFANKTLTF